MAEDKQNLLKENDFVKLLKKPKVKLQDIQSFLKNNILNLDENLNTGYNCLHFAIKTENPDIVSLLFSDSETGTLSANPNVETKDVKNETILSPLQYAIREVTDPSSLNKIIKLLIKNGADIYKKDEFERNIFHLAGDSGNVDLIGYILEKDANILNSVSKYGSVLHSAVSNDHTDVVEELLNQTEIDLKLVDYTKNSALLLSIVVKNFNCFKLIFDFIKDSKTLNDEEKKFLFNQKNEDGNTLLHELAYAKSERLINMILKLPSEISINPEEKNKNGHTYKNIQEDIVKMIKEKEEQDKKRREELREQKKRIIEEEKRIEAEFIAEREKEREEEERSRENREKILQHKGKIFAFILIVFMMVLFYGIQLTIKNKKKEKII